jgi:phosphate:Na+ symporter
VWGTHIVRSGVLRIFGRRLRQILATSVSNRFTAAAAGLAVTGLVQSSSATAMIAASFVSQGMIGLAPALAVMLGADVGTAVVVNVFALDLSWLSPLFITVGVFLHLSQKGSRLGHLGRLLIGLGLIIIALQFVMSVTRPLTETAVIKTLFISLGNDKGLALILGAIATVLAYSSLAVVLLVSALASTQVLAGDLALYLVLGANLGSAVLAVLNTWSQGPSGRGVALGNFVFKAIGCVVFVPLLPWLHQVGNAWGLSNAFVPVQFHLLFNTILAVSMIGFIGPVANLVLRFSPAHKTDEPAVRAKHLDPAALDSPSLALANASREVLRMGDLTEAMLVSLLKVIKDDDKAAAAEVKSFDDDVDRLYSAIKLYLTQLSRESLDDKEGKRWTEIISLAINFEHAGDVIERIAEDVEHRKIRKQSAFSSAGMGEIELMHTQLLANLRLCISVFLNHDIACARQLMEQKLNFRALERKYSDSHLARLSDRTLSSLETSSLHLDLISEFKTINAYFCSVAYPIVEAETVQSGQRELNLSN